jgi:hypothetical protein
MEQDVTSKKSGKDAEERDGIHRLLENTVSSTYEDLMAIIDAKVELIKIDLAEKIALVASLLVLVLVMVVGIAYLITTAALLIGELLGHLFLGYLIVSLFFIVLFVFFTKIRPDLLKNVIHKILLSAHDNTN